MRVHKSYASRIFHPKIRFCLHWMNSVKLPSQQNECTHVKSRYVAPGQQLQHNWTFNWELRQAAYNLTQSQAAYNLTQRYYQAAYNLTQRLVAQRGLQECHFPIARGNARLCGFVKFWCGNAHSHLHYLYLAQPPTQARLHFTPLYGDATSKEGVLCCPISSTKALPFPGLFLKEQIGKELCKMVA